MTETASLRVSIFRSGSGGRTPARARCGSVFPRLCARPRGIAAAASPSSAPARAGGCSRRQPPRAPPAGASHWPRPGPNRLIHERWRRHPRLVHHGVGEVNECVLCQVPLDREALKWAMRLISHDEAQDRQGIIRVKPPGAVLKGDLRRPPPAPANLSDCASALPLLLSARTQPTPSSPARRSKGTRGGAGCSVESSLPVGPHVNVARASREKAAPPKLR